MYLWNSQKEMDNLKKYLKILFFFLNLILLIVLSFILFNIYAPNEELPSQTVFKDADFESENPILRVERYEDGELKTLKFSKEEQKEIIKSLSNATFVSSDKPANFGDFEITLTLNKLYIFSIDSENKILRMSESNERYQLKDSNFIELLLNL